MLGVAAVSIGSYAAYAGNSATMTVTATIEHDVQLGSVTNLSLGTITINPAYDDELGDTFWEYSDSGVISYANKGAIVSASNATVGIFTANIPNPSACNTLSPECGGLSFAEGGMINNFFGGNDDSNVCRLGIKYSGSENIFKVYPHDCYIALVSSVTTGLHERTITISYNAS